MDLVVNQMRAISMFIVIEIKMECIMRCCRPCSRLVIDLICVDRDIFAERASLSIPCFDLDFDADHTPVVS